MNTKYDPEDIEYLLKSKSFDELYDDERIFVLKHMEDQHEYESMRKTLMLVSSPSASGDTIEPREDIKSNLLAEFDKSRQNGFVIWLNGLLAFNKPNISWYRQPAYQLAFASVVIIFGVFWFASQPETIVLADNNPVVEEKNEPSKEEAGEVENVLEAEKDLTEELADQEVIQEDVEPETSPPTGTVTDNTAPAANNEVLLAEANLDLDSEEELIAEEAGVDRRDAEQVNTIKFDSSDDMAEELDVKMVDDEEQLAKDAVVVTQEISVAFADEVTLIQDVTTESLTDSASSIQLLSGSVENTSDFQFDNNSLTNSASGKEVENLFDELFTAL